jgi:peptidylprolyl isomerase
MNVPRRPTLLLLAALLLPGCGDPGDPDEKRAVEAPYGQGLKYVDLLGGDGEPVKEGDVVEVRYTGMLHADGKPFEGAAEGKPPLRFLVGNGDVVRGFDAGVVGMHPGGKRKLYVPSALGYGSRGLPGKVPSNADLIYAVELLRVERVTVEDLRGGDGPPVTPLSFVVADLKGSDRGGKAFVETEGHGPPARFAIGSAPLRALDAALVGMRQGGRRKVTIPPELAVFRGPPPQKAPRNATLVYEVQVLQVFSVEVTELKEGSGPAAKAGDTVSVHYTGTLRSDGKKFDSSLDRGQPLSFKLGSGQVIKGWDMGVAGMKAGGKRKLVIPADLAYGDRGSGQNIPPGADLVFEVELLSIK